jgi:dTMP kinase
MNNLPIISIEGVNGAGKTTLITRLIPTLEDKGHAPLLIRSPGGTPRGEQIRTKVKAALAGKIPATALTLAKLNTEGFLAAQSELIAPARQNGHSLIVLDRWMASAHAYQGAQGLPHEKIDQLNRDVIKPDATILLDCDPQTGHDRHTPGQALSDKAAFKQDVRRIYLERADETTIKIDASRPADEVFAAAFAAAFAAIIEVIGGHNQ